MFFFSFLFFRILIIIFIMRRMDEAKHDGIIVNYK